MRIRSAGKDAGVRMRNATATSRTRLLGYARVSTEEQHTDRAAHERAVDPDVLQIAANFRFDLPAHFIRVPAFYDVGDQHRQLAPIAHDQLVGQREPPGVQLVLNRRLAAHTSRERHQHARHRAAQRGMLACEVGGSEYRSSLKNSPNHSASKI